MRSLCGFKYREHQDPVGGVANDGHQPENRADCQQHAVRGNRGKGIRRTKNRLEEYDPTNAYDHPREVKHPHDPCCRSVRIHFSSLSSSFSLCLRRDR